MFKLKVFLVFTFVLYFTLIFLFVSPSIINASNLFDDNFEDPVSTSTKWLTYGNAGWYADNGYFRISLSPGLSNLIPDDSFWSSDWTNIRYELDLIGQAGVDKNILIKFVDQNNFLEFHANDQGMILEKGSSITGGQVLDQNQRILQNNTNYHFRIDIRNNSEIKVYIDDVIQLQGTESVPLTEWKIGLRAGSGGAGTVDVKFDNVVVSELPAETATPSPSPSPSPTPTPSPSPNPSPSPSPTATASTSATPIVALNVPSLKQYSMPWKNKIYAFTKNTIHEFGCALTSAAMVLQYHGHNINPDKLNDWLKNQSDGYIRNGLINWLAVSRYTKIHDSINSPTLEYKRLLPTTENLINELNNGRPAILKENGHFVVAKSILQETFGINDPGYASRKDLTSYGNAFLAINSYTPTHSDLSYMMFVIEPQFDIKIYDNNNNLIPADSFVEEPINSLLNPNKKSGSKLKIVTIQKPQNGNFILKVTGPKGNYNLDSYLYDTNGKVSQENFDGRLNGNDTDRFDITFGNKKRIKEKENKSDYRFWFKSFFDKYKHFRDHD